VRFRDQKLDRIIALLEEREYWSTQELETAVGASRSTIQRLVEELQRRGSLTRIHGGVRRTHRSAVRPTAISARSEADVEAKRRICFLLFDVMPRSGLVYLDAGTTIYPLASIVSPATHGAVEFVTNDVRTAAMLSERGLHHLLLGGQMHMITGSVSGPVTQQLIGNYHFDMALISVDAIASGGQVVASVTNEALLKRSAMENARESVLVATTSKRRDYAGTVIAPLDRFDVWVAEDDSQAIRKQCDAAGVRLIVPG
jgi:DeoR family transcriptional regulator, fructose operon transcriptional repressor